MRCFPFCVTKSTKSWQCISPPSTFSLTFKNSDVVGEKKSGLGTGSAFRDRVGDQNVGDSRFGFLRVKIRVGFG